MNGNTKVRQADFRLNFWSNAVDSYVNMIRHARVAKGAMALLLAASIFSGCETTGSAPAVGADRSGAGAQRMGSGGKSVPAPSADVKKLQSWNDANMIAARGKGREALVGGGASMNPVYGDNTMLVVHPIEYQKLAAGMVVVYVNREGRRVAHQLIAKEAGGWRARGLNNQENDPDLVTRDNLVGVVYASLVHAEP